MPRPKAIESYPREMFELLEELAAKPSVVIACGTEKDAVSLRIDIYNFFRVMRREAGAEAETLLRKLIMAKRLEGDPKDPKALRNLRVWIEKANDSMVRISGSTLTVCSKSESRGATLLRQALSKPAADLTGAADESLARLLKGDGE